jgi:hypothetical protein
MPGCEATSREAARAALDPELFERDGFAVLRGFWGRGRELDDLQSQLDALGKLIVGPQFSATRYGDYREQLTQDAQSLLYDRLKYLPALSRMSGSAAVRDLCLELGLGLPSLMGCCNMRLDKPADAIHLFEWHQDTVYLLGSTNALTLWVPLQDVDLERGTIQVIPGSHKQGIYPFRRISDKLVAPYVPLLQRDICLDVPVTQAAHSVEARRGDLVVFKQMLLHRSTPNRSDQIRWTAQIRVTDLGETEHRRQRYPTGDRSNILYVDYPGFKSPESRV